MLKKIIFSVISLLIIILCSIIIIKYNISAYSKNVNSNIVFTNIENQLQPNDTKFIITNFFYNIKDTDNIKIYLYDYKSDGVNNILTSETQIKNIDDNVILNLNKLITKVNGSKGEYGILYGPQYTIKIQIISNNYEMNVWLYQKGYISIKVIENGKQTFYFTIKQQLSECTKELISIIEDNK